MSTTNYGIADVVSGGLATADGEQDLRDAVDNQLDAATDLLVPNGVLSGWEIEATGDLNVNVGEGWINGARCKTAIDQAITGMTIAQTYYIWAQFVAAAVGRVSTSFKDAAVSFVATTGADPGNAILLATGVLAAGLTEFSSVNNTPNGRVTLRTVPAEIAIRGYETNGEYVDTGLLPQTSVDLTCDVTAGVAYIRGVRVVKNGTSVDAVTCTLSNDNYIDLDSSGVFHVTPVALDAAEPAIYANSIRLAKAITDADKITSVVDMRHTTPFVDARYVDVADTGAIDTEFVVAHGLSRIPIGYLVTCISAAGIVYDSVTAVPKDKWTSTNIYLKCSVANAAVTLLIF